MGLLGDTVCIIDGRQSRIMYLSLLSRPRVGSGRADTLARASLANFTQSLTSQGRTSGIMMLAQPFSDASRFETSANGRFVAIVDQQDVLSHEQKSIQLLSVTGEQRHRVRLPFADAPLNASIASRLIDSQYTAATEVLRSRGSPVTIDRFQHAAGVYRPRRVVPISGLVVGDDGAVLLRGNDWTGSTVTYAWLRPNGTLRGTLVLPIAHTIKALRGDVIWSVHETEAGLLRLLRQTVGER